MLLQNQLRLKIENMQEPRTNKTKEQILHEMKSNADFQTKMTFVREKFWPVLLEASESIDDASILLSGFNTTLMQEFLSLMKEKKMKDLNLSSKLDADSKKYPENQKLLALFDDMSVFDAKDLIEGMKNEIQLFITEELKTRPLSTLTPTWIEDYLQHGN